MSKLLHSRGKGKGDKWVVGWPFKADGKTYMILETATLESDVEPYGSAYHLLGEDYFMEVTDVSQSTGRFDKNKVEIFGGDVDRESGGKVVWNQDNCAFLFDHPDELMELVDTEKWFEVIPEGSEE